MATEEDITELKKWIASIKMKHIAAFILIVIVLYIIQSLGGLRDFNIDRTNYKTVAEKFITDSPAIAQKLGKVTSISHIGVGGSTGKVSHNAFSVKGEMKSGVCYITLNKDNEGLWWVDSVTLLLEGSEYSIPVKRSQGRGKFKIFD